MKCSNPRRIYKNLEKKFPMGLLVPCGQCIQCRINRREVWTLRIMHEFLYWDSCIFVTLTYDEEHLSYNIEDNFGGKVPTLRKSDLQKFFKRLRKNDKRKIKYFACGEYGETTGRPHYHVIMFGYENSKEDRKIIMRSWDKCKWNELGKKPFGNVTKQSIAYVVSYIEKSITGKWEDVAYENCEKPFQIVSKGMGKLYAINNKNILQEDNVCIVKGKKVGIPRYYKKVIGLSSDASKEYFIDTEREKIQKITGVHATLDELYLFGSVEDNQRADDEITKQGKQRDMNIVAMQDISRRKRKRKF